MVSKKSNVDANRRKALDLALSSIEKSYGKGAVMRLGDKQDLLEGKGVVSTGSLGIDIALGVGGLPRGRVVPSRFACSRASSSATSCTTWSTASSSASPS